MSDIAETSAQREKPKWVWFSTHETIENEIASVTAVLETIVAVPLYWWLALKVGVFWPLVTSVAVAPLVLLHSDQSVKLGLLWFRQWERRSEVRFKERSPLLSGAVVLTLLLIMIVASIEIDNVHFKYILYMFLATGMLILFDQLILAKSDQSKEWLFYKDRQKLHLLEGHGGPFGLMLGAAGMRLCAAFVNLSQGLSSVPRNFRRLTLCTSPMQIPELLPGIERSESKFATNHLYDFIVLNRSSKYFPAKHIYFMTIFFMLLPSWLYRLTIKSTAWFWWPLAFLGGDLQRATNPKLFHWQVSGSLWAKASIGIATGSLLAFLAVNLLPKLFAENPLLTPFGYLLLMDWSFRPPSQILAFFGALLSLWIVLRVNDASGEYEIAQEQKNAGLLQAAERKFGRTELLARVRLLVFIAFWLIVGVHALLYFNSQSCWFTLSPGLHEWAVTVYGERLPRPCQCGVWPFFGLEPLAHS